MSVGISVRGLSKSFSNAHVLQQVDLDILPGEFTVLLGPSGCGKSTLLANIAGLEDVDTGAILIGGDDVTDVEPSRRGIAMVFQSYALYPSMTVRGNLSFGLKVSKVRPEEIRRRVDRVAELLQIGAFLDRKPAQLSGGQRQRVAIGRALVREAKVFLFDEPLSNLDAKLRTEMRIEIKKLHQKLGSTIVYVTHDQIEAMTLATRIAVMRGGKVEQYAAPEELYERPATLFVAGFVGSPAMNFLRGRFVTREGGPAVEVAGHTIDLSRHAFTERPAEGDEIVLGLRPEDIRLAAPGSVEPAIEADLRLAEPMGADTLVWFDYGAHSLSVRLSPQEARTISGRVPLALDIAKASVFSAVSERRL